MPIGAAQILKRAKRGSGKSRSAMPRPAVRGMRLIKLQEYKETTKKGHKRTVTLCTYVNTGKDYRKGAE